MAVSFIRTAESHTGTTASASVASYTFALGIAGDSPKGVVVFTMQGGTAGSTEVATAVTYGGVSLTAITGGSAADTVTEPGRVTAWLLGASVPTGAQSVVVTRTNNTTTSYAVGFLLGGAADLKNAVTPVLQQNNGTITAVTIDPGTDTSIVLAAAYSGDNTPAPTQGTSMTLAHTLLGTYLYSFGACYETTPTTGSRSRGCSQTTSDDRAHVIIAITELATRDVTLAEESTSSVAVVPTEVPGTVTRDVTLALESVSSVAADGSITQATRDVTLTLENTSAVTAVGSKPPAPATVTVSMSGEDRYIEWDAVYKASGYVVERSVNGGAWTQVDP